MWQINTLDGINQIYSHLHFHFQNSTRFTFFFIKKLMQFLLGESKSWYPSYLRNLDYFYPHFIQKIGKFVFRKILSCNTHPWHLMESSLHSIRLQACYRCAHFIQHTLVLVVNVCVLLQSFLMNNLTGFPYSAGKKYQDFIQSLVMFTKHMLLK